MAEELKDYTALNINEFLVSDTSVLTEYGQTDALAFDQAFEGVPGGNIIFGGMQIRKKRFADTDTAGVWIGVDSDGIGKINVGDDTNFLLWNGSELVISGNLTATSGTIGGWVIAADTLTGGNITLDSSGVITSGTLGGQRVEITGDSLDIYDSGNVKRIDLTDFAISFYNSSGVSTGDMAATSTGILISASGTNKLAVLDAGTNGSSVLSVNSAVFFTANGASGVNFSSKDILPDANNAYDLGSGGNRWAEVHTNALFINGTAVTSGADTDLNNLTTTSINESLIPAGSTQDLGTSSLPWDRLYVDDIYLTNNDGGIYYNSNLAIDMYATRIELGSTYSDFSPASGLSANLGNQNRWSQLRVDTIDMTGALDMNGNDITAIDELRFATNTGNPTTAGDMHYFDSGGTQEFQVKAGSFVGSIDLTAT